MTSRQKEIIKVEPTFLKGRNFANLELSQYSIKPLSRLINLEEILKELNNSKDAVAKNDVKGLQEAVQILENHSGSLNSASYHISKISENFRVKCYRALGPKAEDFMYRDLAAGNPSAPENYLVSGFAVLRF
jgi:hypothetical protein